MRVSSCSRCAAPRMSSSVGSTVIRLTAIRAALRSIRQPIASSRDRVVAFRAGSDQTCSIKGVSARTYQDQNIEGFRSSLRSGVAAASNRALVHIPSTKQQRQLVQTRQASVSLMAAIQQQKQLSSAATPHSVNLGSPSTVDVRSSHPPSSMKSATTADYCTGHQQRQGVVDSNLPFNSVLESSGKQAVPVMPAAVRVMADPNSVMNGSSESSGAAAAAAGAAVGGSSSVGRSSSRGRGRRGDQAIRSRAESREFVLNLIAKNEADEAAEAAAAAAQPSAAAVEPARQRSNKRKSPDTAAAAVVEPLLPAGLLAAAGSDGSTDFAAMLAQLAQAAAPAPSSSKPSKRSRRKATAEMEDTLQWQADPAALLAAAAGPVVAAANLAAKPKRAGRKTHEAATAAAGSAGDAAASDVAAAADSVLVKSKRGSRKKAAATAAGAVEGELGEGAAVVAPPPKPVRRTKKVIAAEVAEAARQGRFDELTSLTNTYSHIALYNNNSNSSVWQQLVLESSAAAAAAGNSIAEGTGNMTRGLIDSTATALAVAAAAARKGQQLEGAAAGSVAVKCEQQQLEGSSSSGGSQGVLCRVSGLGSYRQQVWLHNVTHDAAVLAQPTQSYEDWKEEEMQRQDAEVAAAAAEAAAGEEGEVDEQQQQQQQSKKKQKKQTPRKFTRSSSTTPYGQGVLSSQPSTSAAITDSQALSLDAAVAAAAEEGTGPASGSLALPDAAAASPEVRLLPNLGYACLCMTMRQFDVFNSRDCVKKTRDGPDGLAKVSQLALANARDLLPMILWNEAHGIRLFRLSSCILPWMTSYQVEELPDWPQIQQALREAGDAAKRFGHRLTFHPSEYCKIAGERADWVTQSVRELEVHSRIFDEMGFLPPSPHNKINIHVGGTYGGEKEPVLRRFAQVINERLSLNCKARMTVENDDRANMYSVKDLMLVHELSGIPIVFDFHHWKFCTGGQTQEEAFRLALTTWPEGVRPLVHWSESPEDPDKMRSAHSDYIDGPINLFGLEGEVDVMIESKAKELALLEYRQAVVEGWTIRPKQRNAELVAAAAVVKAEAAAAKAEAKAAKAAEKGDAVQEGVTAAGRAVRRSTSSRGTRRKKNSKDRESEEEPEVDFTDDDDEDE